ncbi:unnamed protein product [Rhodiola kirilowii]
MASVCPFGKALRPVTDGSATKHSENQSNFQTDSEARGKSCPFAKLHKSDDSSTKTPSEDHNKPQTDSEDKAEGFSGNSSVIPAKCPYGFDSQTFKIGPFSCVICQALLFKSSRCVPCSHVFCYACVSRFKDCPLCGADIEKIEDDPNLQAVVDHVSLERGAFLVQHAMRAFRAQNIESAKARLSLCSEDIREQLKVLGSTPELCSQLGAVLGMLGDCCRALGESDSAVLQYEESVEFLQKLPIEDQEIVHTLSVSLNKIGDLKYHSGDLQSARSYYSKSLNVRREATKRHPNLTSQVLDVAVSLAKVADIDLNLGNKDAAIDGFQEGLKLLESLTTSANDDPLEQRRASVMDFLKSQLAEKQSAATDSVHWIKQDNLICLLSPTQISATIILCNVGDMASLTCSCHSLYSPARYSNSTTHHQFTTVSCCCSTPPVPSALYKTLSQVTSSGVIACLRAPSADVAREAAGAALSSGISVLEIVMSTPGVFQVGTVLNAEDAKKAVDCGAKFLMSPATVTGILDNARNGEFLYIPGVMTPAEILAAHMAGAHIVKVYPVSALGGVQYISALNKPFPHIPMVASQGIAIDSIDDYIACGAASVVLSDAIFNKDAISHNNFNTISHLAYIASSVAKEALQSLASNTPYLEFAISVHRSSLRSPMGRMRLPPDLVLDLS